MIIEGALSEKIKSIFKSNHWNKISIPMQLIPFSVLFRLLLWMELESFPSSWKKQYTEISQSASIHILLDWSKANHIHQIHTNWSLWESLNQWAMSIKLKWIYQFQQISFSVKCFKLIKAVRYVLNVIIVKFEENIYIYLKKSIIEIERSVKVFVSWFYVW